MKITKTSVESKMTITVTILFNNLRSINLVHVYMREGVGGATVFNFIDY